MNAKEVLTIKDLATDSFFKDLRDGNFILILGAGFSCKIKNQVTQADIDAVNDDIKQTEGGNHLELTDCRTIPLSKQFTRLTNKIYGTKLDENDSTSYTKSANKWIDENYKLNGHDLSLFFKKIFQPDEDELKSEANIYKRIFNVNWNNIYTFNFDTVLEDILRIGGQLNEEAVIAYPDSTSLPNRADFFCIAHLHGIITSSDLSKLVFGEKSYTHIRARAQQTLYDYFHGELEQGKKAFIIGTRFDESVIDDKLFHDLTNPYIYYLGLERDVNNAQGKSFISNNANAQLAQISDISDVLDFFEKYKSRIENIQIEGTTLVTKDFIANKKMEGEAKGFTAESFYLAKQADDIQWYGIINDWDIKREAYQKIKAEVKKSFIEERSAKITAIIYGRGGSGKSTFLRGLAVDLAAEDFVVLWINDAQIDVFYEKGLQQLKEYPDKKFLVLIEDWYRNKKHLKESAQEFLNSICSFSNVRIVIGDRTIDSTILKEHRYNFDENGVELTARDNEKTIGLILEKITVWKSTAEKLLTEYNDYNSTLYLILWTIARTFQKNSINAEIEEKQLKQKGISGHFIDLVESDLRTIREHYPGLAKMIFYWASVYKTDKFYIGFDSFVKLAKAFDIDSNIDCTSAFIFDEELKPILDIYINKAAGIVKSAGQSLVLAFNHDILAEEGLSEAKLDGWHKFDNSIKLKMLATLIEGDDAFSASVFLRYVLNRNIPHQLAVGSGYRKSVFLRHERTYF